MSVKFTDNSKIVIEAMQRAEKKALTAIGISGTEKVTDYMRDTGRYGPGSQGAGIWDSGDLLRDVNYNVRENDKAVDIGNSLEYAIPVHNGTRKMPARPYLFDAGTENTDLWREIAEEHISNEMK